MTTLYGMFLFFGVITFTHSSGQSWEDYQKAYVKKVSELAGKDIEKPSLEIKVIEVPELDIRDRCTTCHIAMDDLRMFGEKNPLKPHPSDYLQQHPPERFGCTICHGGQGESLSLDKAQSGTFRRGDLIQLSCSSCHTEVALEGAPEVNRGKSLLKQNQCINCHYTQDLSKTEEYDKVPVLRGIGDKVSEKWLWGWLKDPKSYMPNATMPRYEIDEKYVDGLVGYLMDSKDPQIEEEFSYPEGDVDKGKSVLRMAFCISCHPFNGKGGKEAPDLGRIGNKVTEKWLVKTLRNPHLFQPDTPMPQYNFSLQQLSDMSAYLLDEFTDYDMLDEDKTVKLPHFWSNPEERSEIGRRVYKELRCANCHGLVEEAGWWRKIGPEFTVMGDKPLKEIDFGDSKVSQTLPDYIFEKIRNPQTYATPDNFMRMPRFDLSDKKITELTLALLGFNSVKEKKKSYRVPKKAPTPLFLSSNSAVEVTYHPVEPRGAFGDLVAKFRCFSCHSFKGRGNNIAYDLTVEGSRVHRKWLYHYLKNPYSLRPILTIRMPIFNMTDEETRILTSGFMRKMVDPEIEKGLPAEMTPELSVTGKNLFEKKGCLACHQVGRKGGYVGPSFTQGAFVGEKLQPGWTFKWLKNSQEMDPNVLEPNYGLSDQEVLSIAAYLMSIKGTEPVDPKDAKQDG